MLLETAHFHYPKLKFHSFDYRAHNPLIVNSYIRVHGAWEDKLTLRVWAEDDGVVGMSGKIRVAS